MNQTPCGHAVAHTCTRCNFSEALAAAIGEGRAELRFDELDLILKSAIVRTDYAAAMSVLDIFERDFHPGELEEMLETRVARGDYSLALHAASMAGRKLAQIELDKVAINGLRVYDNAHQAVQMAVHGLLSVAAIRILIDIAVQKSFRQTESFLREKLADLPKLTIASGAPPESVPAEA